MLLVSSEVSGFNLNEIGRGSLICAKHKSWEEWQSGMVTEASADLIRVQYLPSIQNVLNHYFIYSEEAAKGEWLIRYSGDGMESVSEYPEKEEG